MRRTRFANLLFLITTLFWLVTGAVIPCLCPREMMETSATSTPNTSIETPKRTCCACQAEDESPAPPPVPKESNKSPIQCQHTSERINQGIVDSGFQLDPPSLTAIVWEMIEFANPIDQNALFVDWQVLDQLAPPSSHARTLPLLS